MKFSNNVEVTAKDYKAHIDRLVGGRFRARMLSFMGPRLDRIETPDKYTIDFIFKEPTRGFRPSSPNPRSPGTSRKLASSKTMRRSANSTRWMSAKVPIW